MLGKWFKFGLPVFVLALFTIAMIFASGNAPWQMIVTKGTVAQQQRDLLYLTTVLMLLIIIPVIVLLFVFSYKYKETNTKSAYRPRWSDSSLLEIVWWGIPIIIVGIIAFFAWKTAHTLDPYRALETSGKTRIQVVGLQWRWLFIYPDYEVASLSEVPFPISKQAAFEITSDAPMNSFWIPQLGGQVYAMSGMKTQLHLDATEPGSYRGYAANITGEGHASMTFTAKGMKNDEFDTWVKEARKKPVLSAELYEQLRLPSKDTTPKSYRLDNPKLFQTILDRYHNPSMKMEES